MRAAPGGRPRRPRTGTEPPRRPGTGTRPPRRGTGRPKRAQPSRILPTPGRKPIASSESGPGGPPQRRSLMSTPVPRAGRSAAEAARTQADGGYAAGSPGPGALPPDRHRPGPFPPAELPHPGEFPTAGGIPPGPPAEAMEADGSDGASVARSSTVMAVGTLASRGTGFLRTLVLAYALGVGSVSIAYNNANTLPNAVYDLMLGGILTSVVVPLLVNAAKRDSDGGEAYDQRMFTLTTMALAVVTLAATLAAGLLVDLYAHDLTPPVRHLTLIFAFFFIPQIFFYGVSSLAGGVLNARGHFAAPMWTPVINNIVVIAVLLLFIATGGIGVAAFATPGRA